MRPDIVFFQQYAVPYFGILSIIANLKHFGFKADVIIDSLEKDSLRTLKKLQPRLIGFSVLSAEHNWLIDKSKAIREAIPDVTIIVGGIHALFYPDEILSEAPIDIVCNGEGEDVLLNVISELDKPSPDWASIPGLSYKNSKGNIHTNEKAYLVAFKEDIVEDRTNYFKRYPQLAKDTVQRFFSSRGCPYRCSFCYNSNIQDLFKGKGTYVRQKSVENFIKEITLLRDQFQMTSIFFYDDLFTYRKKWINRFLEIYGKEINIPFMCTTRADVIDEDTVRMLAKAGCHTVSYGIETGNYNSRKNVLKKDVTDDQIIRCGHLLHKYGIRTQTTNMFCLPGETLSDAYKTIELNIKAKTNFAFTALFMPFPKSEITEYCIEKGFLKPDYSLKDLPHSFLTSSVLAMSDKNAIINIHRLAFFFVKWPLFYKLLRRSVRFSFLNYLFYLLSILSNFLRHKEERRISLWHAARYAWRLRDSF